jgi:phosphoribosylanthranilate isomerase
MPSGPGVIEEQVIAEVADDGPAGVATFLLTSLVDVDAIVAQQRRCRTNTVQITDRLERGTLAELRAALPGIALVQVVHVVGEASVDEALAAEPHVHAILLDSGNPALVVKELGGTGRRHDWAISARIREAVTFPCSWRRFAPGQRAHGSGNRRPVRSRRLQRRPHERTLGRKQTGGPVRRPAGA